MLYLSMLISLIWLITSSALSTIWDNKNSADLQKYYGNKGWGEVSVHDSKL